MKEEKIPKVGVALLAYNQGKYVGDAIESLKRQTFQDFEVILADDGSNDGYTPKKLESIDYEKIKLKIIDGKNLKNAERRKRIYRLMNNEYIFDFSGDDVLAPDFLEKTVKFLDKHKDYGAVSVNIKYFEKDIRECYAEQEYDAKTMNLPLVLARNRILGSSLMRKLALDETDLSGNFVRYQDWDRWISMLEAGWKIGLVPEFLFYYRHLQNSLYHSTTIQEELNIRKKILKKHKKNYIKYHAEIISEMEKNFLEMKQIKDWLDGQYIYLGKKIKILEDEKATIIDENEKLKIRLNKYDNLKIVRMIRWVKKGVRL